MQAGVANAAGIYVNATGQTGMIGPHRINASAEYGLYVATANSGIRGHGGQLDITTSSTPIVGAQNLGSGFVLTGSHTIDVGAIAALGYDFFDITVSGSLAGDYVDSIVSSSGANRLIYSGEVTGANTVEARLFNMTGGAIDPASLTYHAKVTTRR